MKTITAVSKLDDTDCDELKGKYLDDSYYDELITEDCDCFREDGSILFKFRKNFVSEDEAEVAFLAFKNLAKSTHSRGAAGGPIDPNSTYWKKRKILKLNKPGGWSANYINVSGNKSGMKIQNEVASNLVGYWSETKSIGMNMPCRLSHYSREQFLKVEDGTPFIQAISDSYKRLHPEWYNKQMEQAMIQPDMIVGDTPFSTITINRNFRTGVHKDAGDYGFGNLSCLEYGHYHGGYFVLPKYRIAVDMRHGDHLCVDVHEYHANTEMYETEEDKLLNDKLPDIFKDNLDVGVVGLNNRYARVSLVCYLRGALKDCEMKLDPVLLKPKLPPDTKLTIMYVNKLKDRVNRRKFFDKTWARCENHENALSRIIRHNMKNVIIIDDVCELIGKLGTSNQFTEKDGITYLNIKTDRKGKGIEECNERSKVLAVYIPDAMVAARLYNPQRKVNTYKLYPPMFSP
tara:strand:+ start:2719 stop:4095 length:1377 start_codon:yes stop_codon:yes gene_type:complete